MLRSRLAREIARLRPSVEALSRALHRRAEMSLEEFESSRLLTRFLEREGFRIRRGVAGLPTAFVARKRLGRGGASSRSIGGSGRASTPSAGASSTSPS